MHWRFTPIALKLEPAKRYFTLGEAASALGLYKELEILNEVVFCYRLLDYQKTAEVLVLEFPLSLRLTCCVV